MRALALVRWTAGGNMTTTTTTLGELITALYEEYLELYGDEDVASVATAATINDLFAEGSEPAQSEAAA
jgi:hypothetical protein